MHAYHPIMVDKAQTSLGWMFHYGAIDYGMNLNEFYMLFLQSELSTKFGRGDSRVLAGMSGTEMAMELLENRFEGVSLPEPSYAMHRTPEYWCGWALAYYQWLRNMSFANITDKINILEIRDMYPKYHEMDITQFVDTMDQRRIMTREESTLKRLRTYAGLSQSELADLTEIPVRTIQQYEQGKKDLRKANVDYIVRLSHGLCCTIEDLLQ